MAELFALFTVYHICIAGSMFYIKRYVWAEAGESCLLVLSWMPLCGRGPSGGTGATSAGTAGEGRQPGSNGRDRGKKPWEKLWVCWQEGAGSCKHDGRKMALLGPGMDPVGLVQHRSHEACWMAKQGLQEITCLAWGGLAGGDSSHSVARIFSG